MDGDYTHEAGKRTDDPPPRALEFDTCPSCGARQLEPEYGFCKYGLGSFRRCLKCLEPCDFREDRGD